MFFHVVGVALLAVCIQAQQHDEASSYLLYTSGGHSGESSSLGHLDLGSGSVGGLHGYNSGGLSSGHEDYLSHYLIEQSGLGSLGGSGSSVNHGGASHISHSQAGQSGYGEHGSSSNQGGSSHAISAQGGQAKVSASSGLGSGSSSAPQHGSSYVSFTLGGQSSHGGSALSQGGASSSQGEHSHFAVPQKEQSGSSQHGSSYVSFTQGHGGSSGSSAHSAPSSAVQGGQAKHGASSGVGSSSAQHGSSYVSFTLGGQSTHGGSALSQGGVSSKHIAAAPVGQHQLGASSGSSSSQHGSSYVSFTQGGQSSHGGSSPSLGGSSSHNAPVQASGHHEEPHAHPKYSFKYGVQDKHTGDIKQHEESRDGHVVKGSYSLHEPDGTILVVHYTADKHSGFNAVVQRQGHANHPQHEHK